MARIVLTSFGSFGDVYPYLAIGRRLRERGHEAVIAAPATYAPAVEAEGLEFAPVRPDVHYDDVGTFRRVMDPKRGPEVVVREVLLPHLRDSYRDLEAACDGADLLSSHVLTYAAPILGEKAGLPWVSTVLSPMVFCSAHDPPALAPIPWLARLRPLGPAVVGALWRVMKRTSWSWSEPIRAFRRELGLNADADPLWEGQFSPHGVLALFSRVFAHPQPDWPARTFTCGFPFHDHDFGGDADVDQVNDFLAAGPPPIVFSLGSSAARAASDFYAAAARAAATLGQRAVLVLGDAECPAHRSDELLAVRSSAVGPLFRSASVVVHAGGVGTTGQALRSGRPQVVVPFSHDQFDNALRVARRGVGRTVRRTRLTPGRLARECARLLEDTGARTSAAALAEEIAGEDGAGAAAETLETVLELVRGSR